MTKTILLADDSVTIQKVVELTFMDEDCTVVAVSNGTQALTKLAELTPDIVIADIHMPGADGFEVARQSRQRYPRVPVLLLVGTFEPFEPAEVAAAGADGYLKKPFDSQELLRRVNELLARGPAAAPARPVAPAPPPTPVVPPPPPAQVPAATEALRLDWQQAPTEAATDPLATTWALPVASTPTPVPTPAPIPAWETRPPGPPPAELVEAKWDLESEEVPATLVPEPPAKPAASAAPTPAAVAPAAVAAPEPTFAAAVAAPSAGNGMLSEEDVDRIARRVVELIGDRVIRDVAWEVVPDLAEVVLKARIRELESQVE